MKNDALKKHHFWILFGLVPLFVLIGTIVVSSSVGGEISAQQTKIKAAETAIKSKSNPKPKALLEKMDKLIVDVDSKKDGLWKDCYMPQRTVYSTDAMLALLDEQYRRDFAKILLPVEKLKFGDTIPNDDNQYGLFERKEIYQDWYESLARKLRPTSFAGGWQNTLRWVNAWTDARLTSNQIWLILEDMWVQKSLMDGIAAIDEQMAEFSRVKFERNGKVIDDPADKEHADPLRRKFRGRTWEVELEVVTEGAKRYLKGRLINITDRLQLLGVGNTMTLKVWLEAGDSKTIQPFEFRIGGEFVPGAGGEMKSVKDKDGNAQKVPSNMLEVERSEDIPIGMTVSEIARVEQVFDARTVPVHLIQSVALGYTDSRNADFAASLKPPVGKAFEEPVADASASGTSTGGPGPGSTRPGGGMGMAAPPGIGGAGGGPGGRGGMGQGGGGPQPSGGGTVASAIDGNKKRYIEATEQVRRMPVALTVVVDQSFLQDVLMALANSSLRFQITQVTWKRFRGQLDLGGPGGPGAPDFGSTMFSGQAQFGSEFGSTGPRMPPGGSMSGPGPRRPGFGPGPGPGGAGGMGFFGGGQRPASTVSESQLTSGLIELTVYGIVSLYASPEAAAADIGKKDGEPKKDAAPGAKKDAEPAGKKDGATGPKKDSAGDAKDKDTDPVPDKDKKDKTPNDKEPKKAPTDADPKTPKM